MKKLSLLTILCAFIFSISSCSKGVSKMSVDENLERELQALTVEQYAAIKEELKTLRADASVSDRKADVFEKQVMELKQEVINKDAQLEMMKKKYEKLAQTVKGDGQDITRFGDDYTKGIVFKVQVGAFTNKEFKDKIDGNFWEEDADGVKKYTIGYFRDYSQAKNFKEYMREIGVSDAWIVTYEDNVRKDINNVINIKE